MTDDTHNNLMAQLQRQMKPFADLDHALGGNNALVRAIEDMERQKKMLSAAYGPMEELRRSGVFTMLTEQAGAVAEIQKQLALTTERFKLPEIKLATELMEAYRANQPSELVKQFKE